MDGPLQCIKNIVFFEKKADRKKSFFSLVTGNYYNWKNTKFKMQIILEKSDPKGENYQSRTHWRQRQSSLICPSFFCK